MAMLATANTMTTAAIINVLSAGAAARLGGTDELGRMVSEDAAVKSICSVSTYYVNVH